MSKITIIWDMSLIMFIAMGISAFFGVIFEYFNSNMGYMVGLILFFLYMYFMPKPKPEMLIEDMRKKNE